MQKMLLRLFRKHIVCICISTALLILSWWYWSTPQLAKHHHSRAYSRSKALIDDVYNGTLGFEKIYVVGLASRTDHRDALTLTSAVSGFRLNWIDGVKGEDVHAFPPGDGGKGQSKGHVGSWRAHMNALSTIVAQNLSSALILEDDVDWDIRIKDQLHDFALSSQALIQPLLSRPNMYADPTFPKPSGAPNVHKNLLFDSLPRTIEPSTSPYGDGWDLLWLGHCAMVFPNFTRDETSMNTPKGRVVQSNDVTVPEPQHIRNHVEEKDGLIATYPNHTRVTHHVSGAICSLAYAVSHNGARKLLYEMGVKEFTNAFDMALRVACEKVDKNKFMNSLTVQPPLFEHHRPAGKQSQWSDIRDEGDQIVETGYTQNIRWSTRLNLPKLLMHEEDYVDQWPDAS